MNENENTTTQNLWDTVKAVLRGRFIALQACLKKQEKSQINNITLHLKQLEKEEIMNPRVSRRKEILKNSAEINAKETKETFSKHQLLALLIFAMVSFVSFAFISAQIFKISFLLLTLRFIISSFSSCFRCRDRLFI